MNFLQLCQRLRQETGISDSGPSNVTGQTGDMKRLVDWVNQSWVRIQGIGQWNWMWKEGEVLVPANTNTATTTDRLIEGTIYLDGNALTLVSYPKFRDLTKLQDIGTLIAYKPDGTLILSSTSTVDRTLVYEAYRQPQRMVNGVDVPAIPEPYRMLIVWGALLEYAMFDEAPELAQKARLNYEQLLAELQRNTLPEMLASSPLA